MKIKLSKDFVKESRKLSGKLLHSFVLAMNEVKDAESIEDLTDCKKIVGYKNIYRLRIGDKRAFFNFHVEIKDGIAYFFYLVNRGNAYDKKSEQKLKQEDI